jgi:hypothetical protein
MSVAEVTPAGLAGIGRGHLTERFRDYFWSDNQRRVQTVLGLIWLLVGGLQFQGFMYSHGFSQSLAANAAGQPGWIHDSIIWAVKIANSNLGVWNSLFAITQVLIGFGLLYRPLVKPALLASFGWVLVVWWFGEGFGMMFMDMAQPLTGAPGGVLMYALIGLVVWPNGKPGGLLGARGARVQWAVLWLVMAYLWLTGPNAAPDGTSSALNGVPAGIGFIDSIQNHLVTATKGDGVAIAFVLAALSAAIGIAVLKGWQARRFLQLSILLNLVYWIIPQGLGGIFAGGATDPNSGPLFILLAAAMYPLVAPASAPAVPAGQPEAAAGGSSSIATGGARA